MGTPSAARRDARRNFCPGYEPSGYPKGSGASYKECYDKEWLELQKDFDKQQQEEINQELTLEERVAILEEQVKRLREAGGL